MKEEEEEERRLNKTQEKIEDSDKFKGKQITQK